ncbi:hypothetical protein ILYODFUR_012070 [Ilyodon furcidens]|uniref:Uncharacterized protein n=1 Tax=Ilyodon furcidens TaxID=33524 RepID=A0ABV0TTX5_9TELE
MGSHAFRLRLNFETYYQWTVVFVFSQPYNKEHPLVAFSRAMLLFLASLLALSSGILSLDKLNMCMNAKHQKVEPGPEGALYHQVININGDFIVFELQGGLHFWEHLQVMI